MEIRDSHDLPHFSRKVKSRNSNPFLLNIGGFNSTPLLFNGLAGIEFKPVGSNFPAKFKDTCTNFGDMIFEINKTGPFIIDITNVPSNVLGITHIVVSGNRVRDVMTASAELRGANEAKVATIDLDLRR